MEPVLNHDTDFALVEFQPTVLFSFSFFFFLLLRMSLGSLDKNLENKNHRFQAQPREVVTCTTFLFSKNSLACYYGRNKALQI